MINSQNTVNSQDFAESIEELKAWLDSSDKILIGAGAGLSAAAGLSYLDEDLFRQFQPEMAAMGYRYPYELFQHENDGWPQAREWAYLIRHINFVRYVFPASELYKKLLDIVRDRDYFAVTSNADRQLMRAGFSMDRVFEAQGSYDRLRCTARCTRETWEIKPHIDKLLPLINSETFMISDETAIPYCPYCGAPLYTAFRAFEGYKQEEARYVDWLESTIDKKLCIIELGVGFNTPAVIRWPFERLTFAHDNAHLFRINREYREWPGHGGYPMIPEPIMDKSTSMPYDARVVIEWLHDRMKGDAQA
ncbi:MAG: Sir2 silent information regulator family NAD-dependent deacetylase [Clostridiales bacterium]|nr:Sir2 silent information regulator family NAD-dependent deacetylase [Clostridiales bacterium]